MKPIADQFVDQFMQAAEQSGFRVHCDIIASLLIAEYYEDPASMGEQIYAIRKGWA